MTLRFGSLRGENLAPEDGSTCDPLVHVKIGPKTFKTKEIKENCINPMWKDAETFSFPWDGMSSIPDVEFTVWDYDRLSANDFIGYAVVKVRTEDVGKELSVDLGVRDAKDDHLVKKYGSLGRLHFMLVAEGAAAVTLAGRTPTTSALGASSSNVAGLPNFGASQSVPPQPGANGPCTVRFNKIRCANLPPVDGSTCDPYLKVDIAGRVFQTAVVKNSKGDAQWDAREMTFEWDGRSAMPTCSFKVIDANTVFSDVTIGKYDVQLHPSMIGTESFGNFAPDPSDKKGAELKNKYPSLGTVHFELVAHDKIVAANVSSPLSGVQVPQESLGRSMTASSQQLPPQPSQQQQQLLSGQRASFFSLVVHRAANLPMRDLAGSNDAYFQVLGEKQNGMRTLLFKSKERVSLHPEWNEEYRCPRIDPSFIRLLVSVHDRDPFSADFLGEAIVPFDPAAPGIGSHKVLPLLPRLSNTEDSQFLRGKNRSDFGTIEVSWQSEADTTNQYWGQISAAQQRGVAGRGPGDFGAVQVTILSATNLAVACIPYLRMRYGNDVRDNRAQAPRAPTNYVVWNFAASFSALPSRASHDVLVDVMSDDRVVGSCVVAVPSDLAKQRTVVIPLSNAGIFAGELTALISTLQPNSGSRGPRDFSNSALRLTVVSANSLQKSVRTVSSNAGLNPYVIVTISGRDNDVEYTSPVVRGTFTPVWYFDLPELRVEPTDVITIGVWDEDSFQFDKSLGQISVEAGRLLAAPSQMELQLEDRDAVTPAELWGKVAIQWSLSDRAQRLTSTAPQVIELTIQDALNLIGSNHPTAMVRVSCDDQPGSEISTKLVPKLPARWDECLQLRVDNPNSHLRLSLWDSDARHADFLGECTVQLTDSTEPQLHPLRPRQDPHFYAEDLAILNRTATGFGSLRVAARSYNLRSYEGLVRERLRKRGASYALLLQVFDSADVPGRGSYFVRASAGGTDQSSGLETGQHPRFRKTFEFVLQYDTEMVVLSLMERRKNEELLVGDVSFPISPPERVGVEPTTTWVSLKGLHSEIPTKLLVRWRTTRALDQLTINAERAAVHPLQVSNMQASVQMTVQQEQQAEEVHALRAQLAQLRSTVDLLTRSGGQPLPPPVNHPSHFQHQHQQQQQLIQQHPHGMGGSVELRSKSPTRSGHGQANPDSSVSFFTAYALNVYIPHLSSISRFTGPASSTVADVIAATVREANLRYPEQFSLVFRGVVLPPTRAALDLVPSGETILLVSSQGLTQQPDAYSLQQQQQQQQQQHHALFAQQQQQQQLTQRRIDLTPPPSPPRVFTQHGVPAANPRATLSNSVIDRIANYGSDTAVVTAAFSVPVGVNTPLVASLLQTCSTWQANGFARPQAAGTEVVVQGMPQLVASVLRDLLTAAPQASVEEIRGYIPIMGTGFRVTTSVAEGARMFELCSLPYQGGDNGQSWFYKAVEENGHPHVGVRYIDERA